MIPLPPASPDSVPPRTDPCSARNWRVGTLTYTSAGLLALFAWLLWGDFAWQLKERAAIPVAQLMLRQFGASDLLVSILVGSVPAALGMILGPIVSVRSDRHRGRWGRRIPYLLVPTPFIVIGMVGLAWTPSLGAWVHQVWGAGSPGEDVCRLIAFTFFWGLFEIFTVIANAVFGGLINDVVPPALIGRFFGLFRAVSQLAGILFNFWLIGHAEEHFTAIFLGLAFIYGAGFAVMCLRVKEGDYPLPPPPPPKTNRIAPVKSYLSECYTQPFYLWIFVALMLGNLACGPVNSFSVFYAKSIGMDMTTYGKLLVATYVTSFALSFFLGWLADKFHPIRVGLVTIGLYAGMMLWGGFAATDTASFGLAFIAHGVLTGTFITATASLGQRLFPATKFAQFSSAAGILAALGYVVLPPATGLWLDLTGHVYRHTFTASGLLALLAFGAFIKVYHHYRALGGDSYYRPPE
jgi:MFS family permease